MNTKKIAIIFLSALLLTACTKEETPWQKVAGKKDFKFAPNLECKMLTSTDIQQEKETFMLLGIDKALPVISFEGATPERQYLTKMEDTNTREVFSMLSKIRGARMIFLEKDTGVIGMAVSPDRKFSSETEVGFRGNCWELKNIPIETPAPVTPIVETGSGTVSGSGSVKIITN